MNQLKSDVAKLKKIAHEVEAYIKAELARECDDASRRLIVSPPTAEEPKIDPELLASDHTKPRWIGRS
jgi:hypothetical protein